MKVLFKRERKTTEAFALSHYHVWRHTPRDVLTLLIGGRTLYYSWLSLLPGIIS